MKNNEDSNKEMKKLIKMIIKQYTKKKNEKKISERVSRGRSSSIASEFEDLFSYLYLERKLPECYEILIDFPISYKDNIGSRTKTIYPDICIIGNNELCGIIELKIDLGYTPDNLIEDLEAKYNQLNKVDHVKLRSDMKIRKNLPVLIVVLSGKNDHGKLQDFLRNDDCFVISRNHHPNDIKVNYKDIISDEANLQNWDKLNKCLGSYFPPVDGTDGE